MKPHKPRKRKARRRNSDYKPVFTDAEHKLMQNYGVGNLMDEVGVNRIMLVRTLDKMNQEMGQLTFRDHLGALRAVAYTTGRIAGLLELREKLYKPYEEIEKQYRGYFDDVENFLEDIGPKIFGQKQWDQIQWNALRKTMGLPPIEFEDTPDDESESKQ